jgi:hypothetical protein
MINKNYLKKLKSDLFWLFYSVIWSFPEEFLLFFFEKIEMILWILFFILVDDVWVQEMMITFWMGISIIIIITKGSLFCIS